MYCKNLVPGGNSVVKVVKKWCFKTVIFVLPRGKDAFLGVVGTPVGVVLSFYVLVFSMNIYQNQ